VSSIDDIVALKDKLSLEGFIKNVKDKAILIKVVEKYSWGNHDTFLDHFLRHSNDFGNITEVEYARLANEFYLT
jgi:pyocin large subunit-like protein